QKIIVWSANSHIARSLTSINDTTFKNAHPMTENLIKDLSNNEKIYVLGFTSYKGSAQRISRGAYDFNQTDDNNFESWINREKYDFAFLDFAEFNSGKTNSNVKFFMAPLGHISVQALWNQMFDGIFYIGQMAPCVQLDHHP
ncbi:MAG TPA: hypothetical protein VK588_02545, partial [Chitinophagaceae bacterium]|nr:hypothetical protein [Chitinophagaceae bacterium]